MSDEKIMFSEDEIAEIAPLRFGENAIVSPNEAKKLVADMREPVPTRLSDLGISLVVITVLFIAVLAFVWWRTE